MFTTKMVFTKSLKFMNSGSEFKSRFFEGPTSIEFGPVGGSRVKGQHTFRFKCLRFKGKEPTPQQPPCPPDFARVLVGGLKARLFEGPTSIELEPLGFKFHFERTTTFHLKLNLKCLQQGERTNNPPASPPPPLPSPPLPLPTIHSGLLKTSSGARHAIAHQAVLHPLAAADVSRQHHALHQAHASIHLSACHEPCRE